MILRRAVVASLLLASGRVAPAQSGVAGGAEGRAAEVAAWLAGTFEAKDSEAGGASVRIVVVPVPKSRIANGAFVLYREQSFLPKLDEPTLQRFYRVEEDGDVVRLRAYDPKDPLIVRGKWRDPSTLALYGANDVREMPGCTIALRRTGARWEGGTPEPTARLACPSHLRSAVRTTSSVTVSKDGLALWERGYDEKGRQTWGSLEGATAFARSSAGAPVDDALQERTGGRRAEEAPPALTIFTPSSPSRKYSVSELRAVAGMERVPVSRLLPSKDLPAASVVVVTSRTGSVSVFSSAEISSSSSDAPTLDLSSGAPRLVAAGGRGLDDVVSIELRVLAPGR